MKEPWTLAINASTRFFSIASFDSKQLQYEGEHFILSYRGLLDLIALGSVSFLAFGAT